MEENKTPLKSIWGSWWTNIRKWFYPAWLIYETSIRFYEYTFPVHNYFINQSANIGEVAAQFLAVFCSSLTFLICFFFLTVPACSALFKYFSSEKIISTAIERKIKMYF